MKFNDCLRIVESNAGEGTGVRLHRTEDGRWWGPGFATAIGTQPADHRYQHNGRICRQAPGLTGTNPPSAASHADDSKVK